MMVKWLSVDMHDNVNVSDIVWIETKYLLTWNCVTQGNGIVAACFVDDAHIYMPFTK